jgi:diadenosine tetraphosphate (Ap4A) HIT family hydrolase
MHYHRYPVDISAYTVRSQSGPCFICQIIAGEMRACHPIIYEDDTAIVFFSKHQLLYGYTLVAPRKHREAVTADFTLEEYLALQKIVYQVAEALRQEAPTERMYILSLGSQQGNRHVHWHLAPLPPGVPYDEQQVAALNLKKGVLDIPDGDLATLAVRIGQRILKSKAATDA